MSPGSSPLSRGIRGKIEDIYVGLRIIPALAGNTSLLPARGVTSTDHPRSRGEYWSQKMALLSQAGSSPLSRGILCLSRWLVRTPGIIPALAGNTQASDPRFRAARDHPRSRGEYMLAGDVLRQLPGSSPLSRGILSACP